MKTPPRTTRIWLALSLAAALAALPLACSKEAEPASPTPSEQAAPVEPAPAAEPASPESPAPASNPSSPDPARPSTPDECRAAGGTFVASIGDEPKCPAGTTSLGPIRHGIEGGLCCK